MDNIGAANCKTAPKMSVTVVVTVEAKVLQLLHQSNTSLEDFIKSQGTDVSVVTGNDVTPGACKVTGSLECIEDCRAALKVKMREILAMDSKTAASEQFLHAASANEINEVESLELTTRQFKPTLESYDSLDFSDVHSTDRNVNEVSEGLPGMNKPKRVRKLKAEVIDPPLPPIDLPSVDSTTAEGESKASENVSCHQNIPEEKTTLVKYDALAKGTLSNEEICNMVKTGQCISIDVDKDRHNYLMVHYSDQVNKDFANIFEYEENGIHKVALEPKVNTRNAPKKYESLLNLFHYETFQFPVGIERRVMGSIPQVAGIVVTVVVCEDSKSCKLLGCKKNVKAMRTHIDEQLKQLDQGKGQESRWEIKDSKKKNKKKTPTLSFLVKDGRAFLPSSELSQSEKKSSVEVKVIEWRADKSLAEAGVFAVDSKLHHDKDSKAIQLSDDNHYTKDCRKSLSHHHNDIPPMTVVQTDTPRDLKAFKTILHIVLLNMFDAKDAAAALEDKLKEGILKCLEHADKELHAKSLAIPHLCPGLCGVDVFAHSAVDVLRHFSQKRQQKSSFLSSVIFVAKDPISRQEMTDIFMSCIDV